MGIFRKAYSIFGAILMLQFLAQLYFMAATVFTIISADDNAKSVYSAFHNADSFAGLHAIDGYLVGLNLLIMLGLSFGARYPRRISIMTGVLFLLLLLQILLARVSLPALAALHGVNAIVMIGLGGFLVGRTWAFGGRAEVGEAAS